MNILFVEDDAMNRRVVRDMLDVAGATMAEADRAEEGLRRINEENFDVVLVDLRMPGMDGLEAIGHIRAREDAKRNLPLIVVTADTALDLRERCLAAGADEVLFKPVAMEALFDAIGRIVASKSGEDTILF
jgi:CheY-like chemotaxis protein